MTSSDEADEHISMLAYRGFGQRLISRAIALELARSILKEIFGEAELVRQGQLTAQDVDDWWLVSGSLQQASGVGAYQSAPLGSVTLEILQFDCKIRKLAFE